MRSQTLLSLGAAFLSWEVYANDAGVGGRLNYSPVKTQTAFYHLFLQGEATKAQEPSVKLQSQR